MAAFKVFVSSTCYDLSIVRSELRSFILNLGHQPIMSEFNDILFDPREHTHEDCMNEIGNSDAIILIIGSRFGGKAIPQAIGKIDFDKLKNLSKSSDILKETDNISITQMEILKAIELDIPIYTFVDTKVLNDHHLYEKNKDKEFIDKIDFPSIDNNETAQYLFGFINFLRLRGKNNSIFEYSKISDIEEIIKKQWSAQFQKLFHESRNNILDQAKNNQFIEGLQDIKSLILSTIGSQEGKDIGKGVLKFRRLIEFCLFIDSNVGPSVLTQSDISWEDVLKKLHIQQIEQRKEDGVDFLYFIKEDGTYYRFMYPVLFSCPMDWNEFKNIKKNVKESIIAAISESESSSLYQLKYFNTQFSDFSQKTDCLPEKEKMFYKFK